jgi:hypothetical protein
MMPKTQHCLHLFFQTMSRGIRPVLASATRIITPLSMAGHAYHFAVAFRARPKEKH